MRASRLLSIVLLLQARGRMTAGQLARELEVSVRTVYRDMEALSAAGIPLYGEAGHDGGYRLLDGYQTRLTGMTVDEAEALFLSGLPGPAADLGLGAVLTAAQRKLMAALPEQVRAPAGRISQRFHLDTVGWYTLPEALAHLPAVVDAIWSHRCLRIGYRRWADPRQVQRTLHPYGLVLKSGRWYLVAAAGESVRTYRVSQIVTLEALDETFERPADFDLARYWQDYLDEFDARRRQGTATVRLSPHVLNRLEHLLDPDVVRAVRDTARIESDGWSSAEIPLETIEHTAGVLLRLGSDAEVLGPPALRQRMSEVAAVLARTYAK
ncbi:YafY family transcriptional regulator [Nocardia terpenica]|uniref:helix-turn-helix transcriptional regulator n=1 Tax=Nocardia terpenica TaxID=455432 RepID=UPI001893E88E|nr:YafY family protein [Nocardia terpenica]MBF6064790.1 YafY family transcriptional regulator [Nocardia terpenica]MBF6107305.1 YafY family transcriptional regulator [Nocardia terpenica]MBF6115062.1 YafY family transcriptional regulator [Nocardia terpenica]MBF6122168.1 YafY family transcriptional regulator [Nocardia terpenica]MBF6154551.1 YafY family transcriptional regulator [Nocardia terpenica]